jgi:DNA-directed RNA polymerase beta' subunit
VNEFGDGDIKRWACQLSKQDAKLMIITVLPVAPSPVRPGISEGGSGKGKDNITYKLADIIKI